MRHVILGDPQSPVVTWSLERAGAFISVCANGHVIFKINALEAPTGVYLSLTPNCPTDLGLDLDDTGRIQVA